MSTKTGTTLARTSRDVVLRTRLSDQGVEVTGPAARARPARGEGWSHEEYPAARLQREVDTRNSHGPERASGQAVPPPASR
jgi:hypothetical protein